MTFVSKVFGHWFKTAETYLRAAILYSALPSCPWVDETLYKLMRLCSLGDQVTTCLGQTSCRCQPHEPKRAFVALSALLLLQAWSLPFDLQIYSLRKTTVSLGLGQSRHVFQAVNLTIVFEHCLWCFLSRSLFHPFLFGFFHNSFWMGSPVKSPS